MNTLLGIIASPRKSGNSELFVRELHRLLPGDWELELVRLPDLDIKPCLGCYKCLLEGETCHQKDDFNIAMEALIRSDAYVVAAPTYLLGPHASLKRFLDRGLGFHKHIDELWGKPAVAVAVAGKKGMEGYTKLAVESFVKLTMGDLRGSVVVYGALPGEIFIGKEAKEKAMKLAEALVSGKKEDLGVPTCPLCGGDTFRFLPEGQIRCMLCSNTGFYKWEDNDFRCEITLGEYPGFLSYESCKKHDELLKEMKRDFGYRKNELKEIAKRYSQKVIWIRSGLNEHN